MRVYPSPLFTNADLSQASLTSQVCDLNHMFGYAIQSSFSGTAVGTIDIQGSCDIVDFNVSSRIVNWSTIASFPLNAPGSTMYNTSDVNYRWVRAVYTRTGGSGTLNMNLNAKGA